MVLCSCLAISDRDLAKNPQKKELIGTVCGICIKCPVEKAYKKKQQKKVQDK